MPSLQAKDSYNIIRSLKKSTMLAIFILGIFLVTGAEMRMSDSEFIRYTDKMMKQGFTNLPFGPGMIEQPNLQGTGRYSFQYFGIIKVKLWSTLVVLENLSSATTNVHNCTIVTTAERKVANCRFTIPDATVRVVLDAERTSQSGNHPLSKNLHFTGVPRTPLSGSFEVTKRYDIPNYAAKASKFEVNPVTFNFGSAKSKFHKCIFSIMKDFGTDSKTFSVPLSKNLQYFLNWAFL